MDDITVHRYDDPGSGYAGYVEPADRSWIVFVNNDGSPEFYGRRSETGAVDETSRWPAR